jgi:deoxyribodipyrimidine photo-lyase
MPSIILFWFRRDLRLGDNAALYHALKAAYEQNLTVVPMFIFDRAILDALDDKSDRRVEFIHHALEAMQRELLQQHGSTLVVRYGMPDEVWKQLLQEFRIHAVYANHDYEAYATARDAAVMKLLEEHGAEFLTFKDQTIFEKNEVMTGSGNPYTVFTPYSRNWKAQLSDTHLPEYDTAAFGNRYWQNDALPIPTLESMGFVPAHEPFPDKAVREDIVRTYRETRNFPAQAGTTRLSVHLRFGTISIRSLVRTARSLNETWLNELIWRDFYMQILWHFPHVAERAFKPAYDNIPWRNDEAEFERWRRGETGYALVDAGMREMNATGYMHNRVRMLTASFLTKHLLIDYRWGEAYFAKKLLDFDLAANNGGWQWAAGTGSDAAPYFRIFNPMTQAEKFDPKGEYIQRWVPEVNSFSYLEPMVDHKFARERALATYKRGLKGTGDTLFNSPVETTE